MFIGILEIFSFDVYSLLNPGVILSFLIPLVAIKFETLPDILNMPFSVSTPVGASVVIDRAYKGCPVFLPK